MPKQAENFASSELKIVQVSPYMKVPRSIIKESPQCICILYNNIDKIIRKIGRMYIQMYIQTNPVVHNWTMRAVFPTDRAFLSQ